MKRNPFLYSGEASGENFWDRERERKELKRDIIDCQKVVVYSKRRMGKTSLVKEVLKNLSQNQFVTAYIDLYPTNSVEDFIDRYASGISQAVRGPLDRALMEIKSILKSFTPALTVDDEGKPVFKIDFGRKVKKESLLDEVLDAFPAYCGKKGKQGVLVLDEFQQIASYDKKIKIEATIRSHFQGHNDVSYIFLGSKKHLLMEIFSAPNRPFYHSAKMFPLEDIERKTAIECVMKRFVKTKCKISPCIAEFLVGQAENNIYYTQKLSHAVWNIAIANDRVVDEKRVEEAFRSIVLENADYFRSMCELLTQHQLGALKVAANLKYGDKVFSKDFLKDHNWQRDSLKQALDALVDKDIMSRDNGFYKIDDIFFRNWLIQN